MFGCECLSRNRISNSHTHHPLTFSLPSPIPDWPPGQGFASGRINLGEIEVLVSPRCEFIWRCKRPQDKAKGISFYKPVDLPAGFYSLGHLCQLNDQPFRGFLLVAREVDVREPEVTKTASSVNEPALQKPVDYMIVWTSDEGSEDGFERRGFIWSPQPPAGYKSMGFIVTDKPAKPDLDEVRCVREDLTDECQAYRLLFTGHSKTSGFPCRVWSIRPCHRGIRNKGVSVGTFFCSSFWASGDELSIACLKNVNPVLHAMPNLEQFPALIKNYGPTFFFHPDEIFLPSSVSWFFSNGALLYRKGDLTGVPLDATGSGLPGGATNDGEFWIDLPKNDQRETVKKGSLESAKLYVHVKPALGGTFTDMAIWVFCPFNGPATLKMGFMNIRLKKIGQHLSDWEHVTLRISNFTGELWSMYFSQHSGGEWVEPHNLEYIEGSKPIVYSSKNGHASYPHPGTYIQGSSKLGIGIRNDAMRSNLYVDSSTRYEVVAAEYLGSDVITEPSWLQFMREWGPKIVYDSRTELDKIIKRLPATLKHSVENIFNKLPVELSGEEGPTGPKEKNNWIGDERW